MSDKIEQIRARHKAVTWRIHELPSQIHDDREMLLAEIDRQRTEIERLHQAHQAACEGGDLLRAEIERLREENEKLLEMVRFYADALEGKP